jgi:hypothetical protein
MVTVVFAEMLLDIVNTDTAEQKKKVEGTATSEKKKVEDTVTSEKKTEDIAMFE